MVRREYRKTYRTIARPWKGKGKTDFSLEEIGHSEIKEKEKIWK